MNESPRDRVIRQLNSLVVFLDLASEDVFNLIGGERFRLFDEMTDAIPHTFAEYESQVAHSAFLLGYSYTEAYLGDLARAIYRNRPAMLPHDKQIKYGDILKHGDYASVVDHLIDREIRSQLFGGIVEIAKYFRERLGLDWPMVDGMPALLEASLIRNALMHNGGLVGDELVQFGMAKGSQISMTPGEVHEYGFEIRDLVTGLWESARKKHLKDAGS